MGRCKLWFCGKGHGGEENSFKISLRTQPTGIMKAASVSQIDLHASGYRGVGKGKTSVTGNQYLRWTTSLFELDGGGKGAS